MTKYAHFDSTVSQPAPVKGWFDTVQHNYSEPPNAQPPNFKLLPAAADLLELTDAQWQGRMSGLQAVSAGALVPYTPPVPPVPLAQQAKAALDKMDAPGGCAIRCFKAGVAFPAPWQAYTLALRAIVGGSSDATAMPVEPPYPAGT